MDESRQHAIEFLEKELKTYAALARFLSKKDIQEHVRGENDGAHLSPAFYEDRIVEAQRLVNELRKSN
jgi:hypothetical protein